MQNAKCKMTTLVKFNVILSAAKDLRLLRLEEAQPIPEAQSLGILQPALQTSE
jgi:hypothetical protein